MRRPLNGNPRITTKHGQAPWGRFGKHTGIDYGVGIGTEVFAPVGGVVREVVETSGKGSGGKRIELAGDDDRWHRFLHLSAWKVKVGQRVEEGQLIALSGNTGDTTGPHLHWDVRKAGTTWSASYDNYFDPEALIAKPVTPKQISIILNGDKKQRWNIRTSPDMGNNVRNDGYGIGGQYYAAEILSNGWAKIDFRSKPGYVGPKAWRRA